MTTEIYYFSGTGNSFAVARDVAAKTNGKLTPITSALVKESIDTQAEVIGFVFPIYDFRPPLIVEKFIGRIKNIGSKYIFAVCTYGITPSKSMKIFETMIKSCGGELAAGFAVGMPHNGIGSNSFSQIQHERMFKNWKIKCEAVSEYIIARAKGKLETSNLFVDFILTGSFVKMLPTLLKLLKQGITKGWKSIVLNSNGKCNGCGICNRICPADNIEIVDNKPRWSDHCAGCFACLHWCPEEAISLSGLDTIIGRYHHPEVKISDMIKQN